MFDEIELFGKYLNTYRLQLLRFGECKSGFAENDYKLQSIDCIN